jgi:hypothetical protein
LRKINGDSGAWPALFRKVYRRVRPTHHELLAEILAVAGTEASPTRLFIICGWAKVKRGITF